MLRRLADSAADRPRLTLALTFVFVAFAGVFGGPVAGLLAENEGDDFADPGSESVAANERLTAATGGEPGVGLVVLVRAGVDIARPAARSKVRPVAEALRRDPAIGRVISFYETRDRAFVSRDRRSTYLAASFRAGADEDEAVERIQDRLDGQAGVLVGGPAVAEPAIGEQVGEDLARAEALAFPILFVVSLLVFRSLVAALLPLLVGMVTIFGSFLALRAINAVEPLSIFALNLVIAMGLGLAIDYSLFVVSRYREELAAVGPGREALRRTLASAGRTVLFSALTVAAAMASLLVFSQRFLYSMGLGGVTAALVAAAVSLIVLPAVLAALGPRVNSLALGRWRRAAESEARGEHGGWYRLSRAVMRRPGIVAVLAAGVLILVGLPFTGIKFTGVDASVLPESSQARQLDDAIQAEFPPDRSSGIDIAVRAPRAAAGEVEDFARTVGGLEGVATASPPRPVGDNLWSLEAVSETLALDQRSQDLVRTIRTAPAPFPVLVGGETAEFVDQQASLGARLPLAVAVLAITTIVLLFLMTGSVILPVKALIMNLLSLSAAFGLLVLIFQDGRFEGLLDYTSQGALESSQPILLFVIAFALSTDYGVFLLTRIKEARDAGLSNREAVAQGLERTGRIVTAAALLFTIAIGAFATSEIIFIKQVGVGTALAVIIDATIVRAFLVPSLMALLGERNWWAPPALRRLHERIGLGGA